MGLTTTPTLPDEEPEPRWSARRVLVVVAVVGAIALVVTIEVRWWRRGGARRTVTKLAEAGAVALADVIVDELLPDD